MFLTVLKLVFLALLYFDTKRVVLPQLFAAKLILLHAIALDPQYGSFGMHSSVIRHALQMGSDYLTEMYEHKPADGVIMLLNHLVTRYSLIPNAADFASGKMVALKTAFLDGM